MMKSTGCLEITKLQSCQYMYYPFPKQALVFTCLQYKSFEITVGIGEIAHNEQFLLFLQCFLPFWNFLPFLLNLKLLSAYSFSLEKPKICRLGKRYVLMKVYCVFCSCKQFSLVFFFIMGFRESSHCFGKYCTK